LELVSIVRTGQGIDDALGRALELVGGLGAFVRPSDRVLVKPNLNGTEGFTSAALTGALIRRLRDLGVASVRIGEATFGKPAMTDMFFKETGYAELAHRLGVELVNLNRSRPVDVRVPNPLAVDRVQVAREVLESDCIINLPNMKVHYATGITVAMKNLKGVLVGDEKRRFHEVGLEKAIADLNSVVRPALNVVDAVKCMERMGPRGGDLVSMDLLIAGRSTVAVDCVAARIMGFEPREILHLRYGLTETFPAGEDVKVVGESIEAVKRPFVRAEVAGMVPDCFSVQESGACSACMNAFLLSCRLMKHLPEQEMEVCMGTKARRTGQGPCIAFGNCCPRDMNAEIRIGGCPPYPFALGESLVAEDADR